MINKEDQEEQILRVRKTISNEDIAWILNIFNTNGSITLAKQKIYRHPMLTIRSLDIERLNRLKKLLGGWIIDKNKQPGYANDWIWKINGTITVIMLLREMVHQLTCLTTKKQAIFILDNYLKVSKRNGNYTETEKRKRLKFQKQFL